MIILPVPTVFREEDPTAWEEYYDNRNRYKKLYEIDRNEYTYVYGLVKDGNLIYIGISKCPFKRYKTHVRYNFNNDWDLEITLLGKGLNRKDMLLVEKNLISIHKPPFNKVHNSDKKEEDQIRENGKFASQYKVLGEDEYKKCIKGVKGFCKKYKFLGRTINKKIPSDYANEISEIIFLLDKKAEIEFDKTGSIEKANQKVEKLLNVIITNLKIGISIT